MKKLIMLLFIITLLYSCTNEENKCSGCKLQGLHYNNSADYTDLLHCKDTVYVIGPKGVIISKLPTGNK